METIIAIIIFFLYSLGFSLVINFMMFTRKIGLKAVVCLWWPLALLVVQTEIKSWIKIFGYVVRPAVACSFWGYATVAIHAKDLWLSIKDFFQRDSTFNLLFNNQLLLV